MSQSFMKITIYNEIPNIMFDRLVSFENDFNGKSWGSLHKAMIELHFKHPDVVIESAPYIYSDLENKTSGFLILDQKTENLYYIY